MQSKTVVLSFILFIVGFAFYLLIFTPPQDRTEKPQASAASTFPKGLIGAFSAGDNPTIAASVGLNAILDYGYNPVVGDSKSTALKAAGLNIIDQMPDKYTRQYNSDGNLSNLISNMTAHLKAVQNNSQIVAYWVLDDWSKDGTAKTALQQITALIHQYTPGKPSICGFSGNSGNYAGKTKNFSPTGCDMVDFYIYPQSNAEYSLPTILPALEAGLKAQGWNIADNPLIGSPLSYGGANGYTVPTAAQVETETKAFCTAGATGLIYYDFGTGTNGSNNAGIQQGIKAGIADCKAIWGTNNTGTSTPGQTTQTPTTTGSVLTPGSGTTTFSLTLCLHGLGNCGDNAGSTGGNSNPKHTQRNATLTIFNTSNTQVGQGTGTITYNTSAKNFQGTISVSNLPSGSDTMTVKVDGFLGKATPGIVSVISGQPFTISALSPTTGDINNDNQFDILDYNLLISCYGSKQSTASCTKPPTSTSVGADIDDDGSVAASDVNLLLRELSVQKGN
ncbi:MAG TPA: dockerin type I domain-containing protein [Candidatus Saccharimonadales bacterium]|nr:dockerin type I domain-containing protein [Candidatus Saccharimonadales bacterium]